MALRRLRELSEPEALRLLAWSLLTILKAECLLRATSLPAVLERFGRGFSFAAAHPGTTPDSDGTALDRLWRYSNFISRALLRSRHPCLLRSLTLYRHCRERGVPASIHFGIKRGAEGLQGHSWITLHDSPLFEGTEVLQSYTSMYSHPEREDKPNLDWVLGAVKGLS
jgi:hypothetical protein